MLFTLSKPSLGTLVQFSQDATTFFSVNAFVHQEPRPFPYIQDGPDGNQVLHTVTHIIPLSGSGFVLKEHPAKGTPYVAHIENKVKPRYIDSLEKKPFAVPRPVKATTEPEAPVSLG